MGAGRLHLVLPRPLRPVRCLRLSKSGQQLQLRRPLNHVPCVRHGPRRTVFRDLTKPMGALSPARLEKFVERCNEEGWMYGSHYSSPSVVMLFLLRQIPDAVLHLQVSIDCTCLSPGGVNIFNSVALNHPRAAVWPVRLGRPTLPFGPRLLAVVERVGYGRQGTLPRVLQHPGRLGGVPPERRRPGARPAAGGCRPCRRLRAATMGRRVRPGIRRGQPGRESEPTDVPQSACPFACSNLCVLREDDFQIRRAKQLAPLTKCISKRIRS